VIFIIIFGIIEQLVHFIMAMSFAIAFFSMFVATLFGFFIRTEAIAWGAFNLILELFVQSIIVSLLMSLVLGFVMMGAQTANAILLLGASLVGLWMSWNLSAERHSWSHQQLATSLPELCLQHRRQHRQRQRNQQVGRASGALRIHRRICLGRRWFVFAGARWHAWR
jgi:hypothetical protein